MGMAGNGNGNGFMGMGGNENRNSRSRTPLLRCGAELAAAAPRRVARRLTSVGPSPHSVRITALPAA